MLPLGAKNSRPGLSAVGQPPRPAGHGAGPTDGLSGKSMARLPMNSLWTHRVFSAWAIRGVEAHKSLKKQTCLTLACSSVLAVLQAQTPVPVLSDPRDPGVHSAGDARPRPHLCGQGEQLPSPAAASAPSRENWSSPRLVLWDLPGWLCAEAGFLPRKQRGLLQCTGWGGATSPRKSSRHEVG